MPPRRRPTTAIRQPNCEIEPAESLVSRFVQYLRSECGMANNTVMAYRKDVQRFADWLSRLRKIPVQNVDLGELQAYLKDLHAASYAASSIARHLVSIKMFFRFLVLEGMLRDSAAELLNSPKLWQHLPKVLSPEKVDQLLMAPGETDSFPLRDRAILATMYATGCRASEVAGLTRQAVDLEASICKCRGKGDKERIVSLNPVARHALEQYLDHEYSILRRAKQEDHLFLSRTGRPLSRIDLWNLVKKYAARIGCSAQVSPHTLRHSFATHLLAGGAEIRALQELLGHANIRTTQVYTHVEHSRLKTIHQNCHPRG